MPNTQEFRKQLERFPELLAEFDVLHGNETKTMLGDDLNKLKEQMTTDEIDVVDDIFKEAFGVAKALGVPLDTCDGAAKVEIALYRWILESREAV